MTSNTFFTTLLSKILEKIEDYKKDLEPYTFVPLEITFRLNSPVVLTTPWIMFDGILSYLYAEMILDDLWEKLPMRQELKFSDYLPLPLKKTEKNGFFYYHASVSRFESNEFATHTIRRFFCREGFDHSEKIKKKYDNVRGEFKSCQLTMISNSSNQCKFWCCGDKITIETILKGLTAIGKNRGSGSGNIVSFKVEEIKNDHSIIHPKIGLNRPLPIQCMDKSANWQQAFLSYKAPYWSKSNFINCYVPEGF